MSPPDEQSGLKHKFFSTLLLTHTKSLTCLMKLVPGQYSEVTNSAVILLCAAPRPFYTSSQFGPTFAGE